MALSLPPPAALAPTRTRAIFLVFAVFVFSFSAYVLTATADIYSTGDQTIRMQVADNIIQGNGPELRGWLLKYPHHMKPEYYDARLSPGRGGKTFSTYLPGQSLAMIPFDLLGHAVAAHERWPAGLTVPWFNRLVGPLFGALLVALFFVFATRLYGVRRSLGLTAVLAFATTVWPDEQSVLEHTPVAFSLLLGAYFAFRYREQGRMWWYPALAGLGLGIAALTRYQDAAVGFVALALYLVLPGRDTLLARARSLALLALGFIPFVVADLWYNWIRFGGIFATGHHERTFGNPVLVGIAGLVVSPGKGILWYCPTLFLLVLAGPSFARRFPALSISFASLAALMVVFYANVTFWHGDPAWGPRYIFPVVPFLTLPLGELLSVRFRARGLVLAITAALVGISLVIQVSAVSVSEWRGWYRLIAYERGQGHPWAWTPSRYRYFWNIHEMPINFQLHGVYQLLYDEVRHSNRYEIVPPDEDPTLSRVPTDYDINHWGFWWASNDFNWWMGEEKVVQAVVALTAVLLASGVYIAGEIGGAFEGESAQRRVMPLTEAA